MYYQKNFEALEDLVADSMVRHEQNGERVVLAREQVRERIEDFHTQFRSIHFTSRKVVEDHDSVAAAYEADLVDHEGQIHTICGIEIFTVADGRIYEVWNSPTGDGSWG
jgi:ketosteroid isomerase-like protein